jgi:iron complex transport system substrate-binding protein
VKGKGITVSTPTRLRALFLSTALALLAAACASPPGGSGSPRAAAPTSTAIASPSPAPVTTYPVTLTDDAGRSVTLDSEPQHVVSLAPSNTEITCALDACDRLAGVPDYKVGYPDDVLSAIKDLPVVVGFGPVDREAIVAADADLILAAGNELTATSDINALADLGYSVLVLYPQSLDAVSDDIRLVGTALNAQQEAADVTADMADRVAAVEAAVAGLERPRTFYEVSIFEGTIYTAGADSFLASLVATAGGDPITGDAKTTAISLEELVTADPQIIVLGDAAYDQTITARAVARRQGWGGMTAVTDDRVIPLPEDILITRPGPRIVDGLEALARAIHPEAFD